MKTIPPAIQADLDVGTIALASCVKITTTGGTVLGFTDWQTDLVVSAVTYQAIGGYTAQAMASSAEMNVDNVDLVGYFAANGITLEDVRTGVLDNAAVESFKVNPRSISDGIIKLRAGNIGRVRTGDNEYTLEVRGLFQRLQQTQGKVLTARCRAYLFDAECQVPADPADWTASTAVTANTAGDAGSGSWVSPTTPNGYIYRCTLGGTTNDTEGEPTWNTTPGGSTVEADGVEWETVRANTVTGTLTGATSRGVFQDSSRTEPDDFFAHGTLSITSGENAGESREVQAYTLSTGEFSTFLPFPFDVAGTEAYTVTAGCAKRLADCRDKFDNIHNRRAEDYVPGVDKANEVPKAR